jgi:hypothetical protein
MLDGKTRSPICYIYWKIARTTVVDFLDEMLRQVLRPLWVAELT